MHIWAFFLTITGINGLNQEAYNFWSGFGSDISEFGLIASAIVVYKHHNCHVHGCPRLGKYKLEGTPYALCKKHHPDVPNKLYVEDLKK